MSPFKIQNSFKARTSFDWTTPKSRAPKLNTDKARQRVRIIQESWKLARNIIARSQARIIKSANAHRQEVDFDIGDYVWLNIKY
jgi:hypothetical protein